jgi:disulfide oxidoreductase YuzD
VRRFDHVPTARASECPACVDDPGSYDHEAVLKARRARKAGGEDFDVELVKHVESVAAGARSLAGVTLHPDAPRRARRWLITRPI